MREIFLRENIEKILDYLDEGVHIIDRNGNIVFYNRAAERLDGVDRNKVQGRTLLDIYPSLDEDSSTLLTAVRTGKRIKREEQVFLNYLGKKITTENTTVPIRNGNTIVGAMEISKNITDVREMSETIVELTEKLYRGNRLEENLKGFAKYEVEDIIGESPAMNYVKEMIRKAAKSDMSVLVSGDTGTGKELVVHAIHNAGRRRNRPFIAQNCAAIPQTLLEGILFGTVKGSFTGAENRAGLFELAHGGTLFLDEVNSMPMDLQSKLLRVLQDGSIRRVGSTKTVSVDVRIMTAMNISPTEAIERGDLRRDLYYRLNVLHLELPRLRDRRSDIPALLQHFIDKYNQRFSKQVRGVDADVMEILMHDDWDGNVRELENVLEGIIGITERDRITVSDLPYKMQHSDSVRNELPEMSADGGLQEILKAAERRIIQTVYEEEGGNISKTAERLRIPRQTLQYKLQKFSLKK